MGLDQENVMTVGELIKELSQHERGKHIIIKGTEEIDDEEIVEIDEIKRGFDGLYSCIEIWTKITK